MGTLHAASLAEVAWLDPEGTPRAAGVIPLLREGEPVLALTFDRVGLATAVAGADVVDLVVREPRNTAAGWRPTAWRCTSRLVEDLDGDRFTEDLLHQELRRFPPARRYADSPLLCREHWWYLPRLLVPLTPVSELDPPTPRTDPDDLLLVTSSGGLPVTGGVRVTGGRSVATWGPSPAPGRGVVHGQDATFPDLEDWLQWSQPVTVDGRGIVPDEPLDPPRPVGPPALRERWRRERAFGAACRKGLRLWTG